MWFRPRFHSKLGIRKSLFFLGVGVDSFQWNGSQKQSRAESGVDFFATSLMSFESRLAVAQSLDLRVGLLRAEKKFGLGWF